MINWVVPKRVKSNFNNNADLDVSICKNGKHANQLCFRTTTGIVATKFHNKNNAIVGFDSYGKEITRICFMPTDVGGYKWNRNTSTSATAQIRISIATLEDQFPNLRPSSLVGVYTLRYDEDGKYWYASIGEKQ